MSTLHRRRDRHQAGFTLVEVTIAVVLLLALSVWAVPRMTGMGAEVSTRQVQASVDQAVTASVTARRETGTFQPYDQLAAFDPDLDLVAGDTSMLQPGQVSVATARSAPTSMVGYAALDSDGRCWTLARSFGAGSFDAFYSYADSASGPCNGQAALTLVPTGLDGTATDRGSSWTRPYPATAS